MSNPLWYKDALIYELHVRAFFDSDADGIGDFRGLTEKLDYLQDLGVTALWLLPFYPSPLKDDGYDIADYTGIHPDYGKLQEFRVFLKEAHQRRLKVITEVVLNHTSDQHSWFQRARRSAPNTSARNFYVWSESPDNYKEARIIFKDFEASNWTWDPLARAYYWHRFYSHQPDLNFDNPEVQKAVFQVLDFWLGMGVDGLRLDAVPYLYEREGTNCENLSETHAFLAKVRSYIDRRYEDRMLLAEANQWPEDAVTYFGSGDQCHMAFHFPVMPRLFMAIHMEDRFPVIDILNQTPEIPESCQWAMFLRNHDELTLEMVTDEDRDYMYRVYATDPKARINLGIRRRLAPLLGNHRRKIELMNSLLLALPGTPVIYYGDEIGMGDNIYLGDRNGVRTPVQWSSDRNAGFSRANPQRLYLPIIIDPEYHYEAINVEAQQGNPHSLLWWMKRIIALRRQFKAFGRGTVEFLQPDNHKVLVFLRRWKEEIILVVANLSRFVQCVELDLSAYKGMVPVEMFGRTRFPSIGELPYFITLGPHAFYWFLLERVQPAAAVPATVAERPVALEVSRSWEEVFSGNTKGELESALLLYLRGRRWFGGKSREVRGAKLVDTTPIPVDSTPAHIAAVEVSYSDGVPEIYFLPLAFAHGERAGDLERAIPDLVVARVRLNADGQTRAGVLYDALSDKSFCLALLNAVLHRRRFKGARGEIVAWPARSFRGERLDLAALEPSLLRAEQSNTSVIYGERWILKLFRRNTDEGLNPDLEIGLFLTTKASFPYTPAVDGALEYQRPRGGSRTLGILQRFVHNEGDAWRYTLDTLGAYFEEALTRTSQPGSLPAATGTLVDMSEKEIPPACEEVIGPYMAAARLLGQRTGELHLALASERTDPSFAPEPFTALDRRSLYQSFRNLAAQSLTSLKRRLTSLPEDTRAGARKIVSLEKEILKRFHAVVEQNISGMRIRCHGDYHLGQLLYTGKDFIIIDFEGEPARPIGERRLKRSPLRDVAGMLRSFHYAAVTKLRSGEFRPEDAPTLQPWAEFWRLWVSVAFLKSYFEVTREADFLPKRKGETATSLDLYLLEKAVYEVRYELNHRPDWVGVPIQGILELLQTS